jgi:hypothetical protein
MVTSPPVEDEPSPVSVASAPEVLPPVVVVEEPGTEPVVESWLVDPPVVLVPELVPVSSSVAVSSPHAVDSHPLHTKSQTPNRRTECELTRSR